VLFPYEAANEDELTLKEGDLIALLSREVADKGWWRGELRGKVGVFPDNFVEVVQQEQVNEYTYHHAFMPSESRSSLLVIRT
jgi:SH3 domain-containing kinase-binding protein 1